MFPNGCIDTKLCEKKDDVCKSVLVANIHNRVTEEILFELFLQAGPVHKVNIFRDGHQKPYGLVCFKYAEAVAYAVDLLNGIWLYGQPIALHSIGGHYQRLDVCHSSTPITPSDDAAVLSHKTMSVIDCSDVEDVSVQKNGWGDVAYNRPQDVCFPAAWYCSPLHQMHSGYLSGTSYLRERPGYI